MIVIIIPAKGGSTRLPNKNMTSVNGRPLIDYSIDAALQCECCNKTFVSTDSDVIADHARSRGVNVIMRSENLGGEVPIIEVYRHALANMDSDGIETLIGLQPDHPDRDVSIDEAYQTFKEAEADVLFSTEADGTKNGAHYVLSRHFVDSGENRKDVGIIDDCTNIHYQDDVDRASKRLAERS
jgi:CMP-N-acetylneuraminic acid synthetase